MNSSWLATAATAGLLASPALAGFTVYQGNGSAWFQAVPSWTTITFAELPANTQVTEQYAPLGVHFTDSDGDWTYLESGFVQDGVGLYGGASVDLLFDAPMYSFASHFPGQARFDFYSGATLLFHSAVMGGGGTNFFAGFATDTPFDRIHMYGAPVPPPFPPDHIFFDNFYFSTVPGPGGAAALALLAARSRRRRR